MSPEANSPGVPFNIYFPVFYFYMSSCQQTGQKRQHESIHLTISQVFFCLFVFEIFFSSPLLIDRSPDANSPGIPFNIYFPVLFCFVFYMSSCQQTRQKGQHRSTHLTTPQAECFFILYKRNSLHFY